MRILFELKHKDCLNIIMPFLVKEKLHLNAVSECYFLCDFDNVDDIKKFLEILIEIYPNCKYNFIFKRINNYEESLLILGSLVNQNELNQIDFNSREEQLYCLLTMFQDFDKYYFSSNILFESTTINFNNNSLFNYIVPFKLREIDDVLKLNSDNYAMKYIHNIMISNGYDIKNIKHYEKNSLLLKKIFINFLNNLLKQELNTTINDVSEHFFKNVNMNLKKIKKF